jgi:preprotein translocase subunit SecD
MLEFPRWKVWTVSLVVALGILLSIPSLIADTTLAGSWPKWLPQYKINLGLDLAGGSHLLLEADARDAQKQRLQSMEDSVSTELRRDPHVDIGDISTAGGRLSFLVRDPTQVDTAVERLRTLTKPQGLTGQRDWDVQVVDSTRIVMIPTTEGTTRALKDAMGVARDVVRRRIDPGGTKEITVVTEGANRVLVEVPGVENPDELK